MRPIPAFLKAQIQNLPASPGVYLFKDKRKKPVYIGKALSLKKRVLGHFRGWGENFSKEGLMLSEIRQIDFIETPTEGEALLLEASLVKENLPRFNKELRDDKSYPYLKITAQEYPRLLIVRGRKADGGKYFGPYTNVRLLRQAVSLLRRLFPMRTCNPLPKKVCLMYHIGLCRGPCEGLEDKASYLSTVRELERFLKGRRDSLIRSLFWRMKEYSRNREYENAQRIYGQIRALSTVPAARARPVAADLLEQMRYALGLPGPPRRIEGFDISNIAGRQAVGSMVVFVEAQPSRADYRRFRIRDVQGIDDYQMMREVIRRRYSRALKEKQALPDLVVIDGGKGHLAAAKKELDFLNLRDLPVIAIAKQHEHLFKPDREQPFIFPQSSPVLHLVQHLRDEAHRFAINYHRRLHKKEAMISLLDEVPGVGPKTREKLLRRVGSLQKIRGLSEAELTFRAGVSLKIARNILEVVRETEGRLRENQNTLTY